MTEYLEKLIKGYQRFRERYFDGDDGLYRDLAHQGQQPNAMVIACADSRVDPAILLQCQPGDLFVARNVANLVPPCEEDHGYHGTSAALEFAVCNLRVKHIILLGHSQCGGIQALLDQSDSIRQGFIGHWMEMAASARDKVLKEQNTLSKEALMNCCAQQSLLHSLENLLTFPWIAEKVKQNRLMLHAWFFDIETGNLLEYKKDSQKFSNIIK